LNTLLLAVAVAVAVAVLGLHLMAVLLPVVAAVAAKCNLAPPTRFLVELLTQYQLEEEGQQAEMAEAMEVRPIFLLPVPA
jgi:hypothetical protein